MAQKNPQKTLSVHLPGEEDSKLYSEVEVVLCAFLLLDSLL